MSRSTATVLFTVFVVARFAAAPASAQNADLSGRWTLDPRASQMPREVGFGADMIPGGDSESDAGQGQRGGGGVTPNFIRRESADDAARLQRLTAEVRTPAARLTITTTPTTITIVGDDGQPRTFHPNGRREVLSLQGDVPLPATSRWEAGRLVIVYEVEQGRQLRYTYSRVTAPPQLIVDVQFVERGGRDSVRRVYRPATDADLAAPPVSPQAGSPATTSAGRPMPQARAGSGVPASPDTVPPGAPQRPDGELTGLTRLGVVVEDLSAQASACGLSQNAIESAVSKSLSEAGLSVVRNTDEDSYAYVNVITASLSPGLCVSRFDVTIYTHTTAKLSYGSTPVLVQVSLLHKGGLSAGAPAAHAAGVLRDVKQYVDQFATRIQAANK